MKRTSVWMSAVGIFYILNLVILWPPIWANLLPQMYPGVDLRQDEAVFRLLLDAWVIVGLGLASIGVVLVYGARDATQFFPALFPVVVITESVFSIWDVYSAFHFEAITIAIVTLIIHGIIIASGFWVYFGLLKSSRKTT